MTETFGPLYERPQSPDCPDCPCCSAPLCERGRQSVMRCSGHTSQSTRQLVSGCPCSAETTPGTHAWRAARLRVTRHATERPLPGAAAKVLISLAAGPHVPYADPENMFDLLVGHGYAGTTADGEPTITPLGARYLEAGTERRFPTPVEVEAVDHKARTARVIVVGWSLEHAVTVLLDQLTTDTGLKADDLPGKFLEANANCYAKTAGEIVLTNVSIAPDLPAGFMDGGAVRAD